jgi:hypothetical protein
MAALSFTQVGDKYESDIIQFNSDSVVELDFDSVPEFTGVEIEIHQSLSQTNWQMCYKDTLRTGLTWCKTLVGVSENAYYKVVTNVNPTNALYE